MLVVVGAARGVDSRLTATLLAARTLPQVVTGPVVGKFLDRRSRSLATCGAAGVTAGSLVLATGVLFGRAPYAAVVVLVMVHAVCEPVLTAPTSALGSANS